MLHRPRAGVPFCRGGRYVVARNDGHTDQDVWYVADSLAELRAGGRVLVDPNRLSAEGRASLQSLTISDDGRYAAIGVSESGSDWQTFRLRDLSTGEEIPDPAITTKFCSAEWLPDGQSFAYLDFGHPATTGQAPTHWAAGGSRSTGSASRSTRTSRSWPSPERPDLPVRAGHRGRPLRRGDDHRRHRLPQSARLYPLDDVDGRSVPGDPIMIMDEAIAELLPIELVDGRLYLETDLDAPRGRVVWTDPTSRRVLTVGLC